MLRLLEKIKLNNFHFVFGNPVAPPSVRGKSLALREELGMTMGDLNCRIIKRLRK